MPAGTFPAGFGPAGTDPEGNPVPLGPVVPVIAVLIDPSQGQYLTDDTGQFVSVHPVDQQACHLLSTTLGKIPSAASFGESILQATPVIDARTPARIESGVRTLLQSLIARKDITLDSVVTEIDDAAGGTLSAVTYTNLRTKRTKTLRLGFS